MEPAVEERPLYNSRIIDTYIRLIRKKYPAVDVEQLLAQAGMTAVEVADQGHWFTQGQINRFHARLAQLSGNPDIALEAGRYSASPEALGAMRQYTLGLLGPAKTYAMVGKAARHFSRSAVYSSRKLSKNSVEVCVIPCEGVEEQPFQCKNRIGTFEAIIEMFHYKFRGMEHTECFFEGGECCRYLISWEKPLAVRLREWRNSAALLLTLVGVAVGGSFTAGALAWFIPLSLATLLLVELFAARSENKALAETVEDLSDPAGKLLEQLDLSYNSARIANEIGQAISRQTGIDEILASVTAIMEKRLDFDRGMILLVHPDRTRLCYRGGYGFSEEQGLMLRDHEFSLADPGGRGPLAAAFHSKEPLVVNDMGDFNDLPPQSAAVAAFLGTRSFICCPIICDEEAIGVLAVDHLERLRDFTQSDVSLLMGIAPLIGVRISNAELLESQQRQRHEILTLEMAMEELSVAKEESEQYASELAEINEEMKNFTYIVSHDLRAPLVNIKGFSAELTCSMKEVDAALKGCLDQMDQNESRELLLVLDEDIPEALEFINSSVQRMDALINAILQLSRIGRRELKAEPVDSGPLVGKILKSLGHQLENRRTEVVIGDLPEVSADAVALEQLLGNLIDNAVKYFDPAREGRLHIWADSKESETVFHVRDNGRGIVAEDQEKIFALFRRSGKQDVQGEGMGLAYVKTLVRRLGGRIWCESQFGEGSTFSFSIPKLPQGAVDKVA